MVRRETRIQSKKKRENLIWEKRSPISDFSNVERERGRFPSVIHGVSSGQELKFITSTKAIIYF